jgi:hypothetical protein
MIGDGYTPSSKLWLFVISKPLSLDAEVELRNELTSFANSWEAHGKPLQASFEMNGQLLVVCVNAATEPASGCSIDKLYALLQGFGHRHALDFLDRQWLITKDGLCLHAMHNRGNLSQLKGKEIADLSIARLDKWLSDGWVQVEDSWVAKNLI